MTPSSPTSGLLLFPMNSSLPSPYHSKDHHSYLPGSAREAPQLIPVPFPSFWILPLPLAVGQRGWKQCELLLTLDSSQPVLSYVTTLDESLDSMEFITATSAFFAACQQTAPEPSLQQASGYSLPGLS